MSCTKVLQVFGGHSIPQPPMPADLAIRLCLSPSPPLGHLLGASTLKPRRPRVVMRAPRYLPHKLPTRADALPAPVTLDCVESQGAGVGGEGAGSKKKRVVFADTKGLALTAVRFFSEAEDPPSPPPEESVKLPDVWAASQVGGEGKPPGKRRQQLQPSWDALSFRGRAKDGPVQLESCSVTERALRGVVRARKGAEKALTARVSFDSGRGRCEVPCAPLPQRHGPAGTEHYTFDIPLPENLDPRECVEFRVSFRPGGQSSPLSDGNKGQNYSVHICPELDAPAANINTCRRSLTLPSRRKGLWAGLPRGAGHRLDHPTPSFHSLDILVMPSRGRTEGTASLW